MENKERSVLKEIGNLVGYFFGTIVKCVSWGVGLGIGVAMFAKWFIFTLYGF